MSISISTSTHVPTADLEAALTSMDSDPAERKRIQGVLAQRRYRQRKRAAREQQVRTASSIRQSINLFDRVSIVTEENFYNIGQQRDALLEATTNSNICQLPDDATPDDLSSCFSWQTPPFPNTMPYRQIEGQLSSIDDHPQSNNGEILLLDPATCNVTCDIDMTPVSAWHNVLEQDITLTDNELSTYQTPTSNSHDLNTDSQQERQTSSLSNNNANEPPFQDEMNISTPALNLVRAHVMILQGIGGPNFQLETIWNPFAESPFTSLTPEGPMPYTNLRKNYLPSTAQLTIPHHPAIDVLPWPSVRDKFLQFLLLPPQFRPKKLQAPNPDIYMTLKYDMLDAAGGIRIQGSDPFNADNWEVGQRFFEEYWWLLDADIVKRSNDLRKARRLDCLRLKPRT